MCISQPKAIPAPTVAPAPTAAQVAAKATADATSLVNANKKLVAKRQGIFGNITTTPMGDASYGTSAVAKFG
jgi:hypothetical protein